MEDADVRPKVTLQLSGDEALVLFEWIHRMEDKDQLKRTAEHGGEVVALWRLSGILESELSEPFDKDYKDLVAQARDRLIRGFDFDPLTGPK
jgi:hypothetical protein